MPYYTYILYSESKDSFYIGSCEDLNIRLKRHNAGATPSTKAGRPWTIVWHCEHVLKSEALNQETYFKKMKSKVYLKQLIAQPYNSSTG